MDTLRKILWMLLRCREHIHQGNSRLLSHAPEDRYDLIFDDGGIDLKDGFLFALEEERSWWSQQRYTSD
jgi:hypothetical protein